MKTQATKNFILALAAVCCLGFFAQAQSMVVVLGTQNNDQITESMTSPIDGMIYSVGRSNSIPFFNKMDPTGVVIFTVEYPMQGLNNFMNMTYCDNGDFMLSASTTNNDFVIMRVDGNTGSIIWVNSYSLSFERYPKVVRSNGDTYYVTGWYSGTGTGGDDAAVIHIDGNGTINWARSLHDLDDQSYDASPDYNGGIIITGGVHGSGVDLFMAQIDVGGNYIQGRKIDLPGSFYENMSVTKTRDDGYALVGHNSNNAWAHNYPITCVKKFDNNFNLQWEVDFDCGVSSYGQTIASLDNGDLVVSTITNWNGANEATLIRIDNNSGAVLTGRTVTDMAYLNLHTDEIPMQDVVTGGRWNTGWFGGTDAIVATFNSNLDNCIIHDVKPIVVNFNYAITNWNVTFANKAFGATPLNPVEQKLELYWEYLCPPEKSNLAEYVTPAIEEGAALSILPNNVVAGNEVRLNYLLPAEAIATVRIVDLSGKTIELPFNSLRGNGTVQSIGIATGELSSGIYTVQMIVGGDVHVERFVVTK